MYDNKFPDDYHKMSLDDQIAYIDNQIIECDKEIERCNDENMRILNSGYSYC